MLNTVAPFSVKVHSLPGSIIKLLEIASVTRGHSYIMLTHLLLQVSAVYYHTLGEKKASQKMLSLLVKSLRDGKL